VPELRRDAYWHAAHEQALIRANDEEHGDLTAGKMQAQTHASPKRDVADAATQLAGSFDLDGFVNAIAVALAGPTLSAIQETLAKAQNRAGGRAELPDVLPCEFRVNKAKLTRQRKTIVGMLVFSV
jgi:hypothetical protein